MPDRQRRGEKAYAPGLAREPWTIVARQPARIVAQPDLLERTQERQRHNLARTRTELRGAQVSPAPPRPPDKTDQ